MSIYYYYFLTFIPCFLFQPLNNLNFTKIQTLQFMSHDDLIESILESILESFASDKMSIYDNLNLTTKCRSALNKTYFLYRDTDPKIHQEKLNISRFYFTKLIFDSSKNINDLSSYKQCIGRFQGKKPSEIAKPAYITVLIKHFPSIYESLISKTEHTSSMSLFGLCVIDDCTENDYLILVEKSINVFELNVTDNSKDDIIINKISNNTNEDFTISIKFLRYIFIFFNYFPLIIIVIHLFFVIFNKVPVYIFFIFNCIFCSCCKKNNNGNSGKVKRILSKKKGQIITKTTNSKSSSRTSSSILYEGNYINKVIKLLYNTENNFNSLIEYKKPTDISNDSGLSYINGIKGISMIFLLFGNVFIAFYNASNVEKNINDFKKTISNPFFAIFYFGIKYAPKLLISSSGFTLFYKMVCFLDEKTESVKENIKQQNTDASKDSINQMNNSASSSGSRYTFSELVPIKNFLIFICYQLHKYFIFIVMMEFFLFCFYEVVNFFHEIGPMWEIFRENWIQPAKNVKSILGLVIGFQSYFLNYILDEKYNVINYFNLLYQEVFYFIISSIIIFIGYKKNLRIDIFFQIVMLVSICLRLLYYYLDSSLDDRDYFGFNSFGQFFTSLFYNYFYYIFGIHCGMINYIIQKRYNYSDCRKYCKMYLVKLLIIVNSIKKKQKSFFYVISIICIFLILLITFSQIISLLIFNEEYGKNLIVEIIMLLDSDFVLAFIYITALFMYLKGENIINDILSHSFWSIFNKFYFSYIIFINPVILYILYTTETKWKFTILNCFLFSFISGIMLFSLVIIFYICFELPYKKFIRFWFKLSEQTTFEKKLNDIEVTFSYSRDNSKDNHRGNLVNGDDDSDGEEESGEESDNDDD